MLISKCVRLDHLAAVLVMLVGITAVSLAGDDADALRSAFLLAALGPAVVLATHRSLLLAAQLVTLVLGPAALLLLAAIHLVRHANGARFAEQPALALNLGMAAGAAFVLAFVMLGLARAVVREAHERA
jgi:hypothetical protein